MLPSEMTDAVRTPDERFEGLPDFPFEAHYREVEGLRLAHLDEGEGSPVIFMHGEPTWSFLWRKVIPPVRDAGFRCIAPDYAGFGRSDKPTDIGWYSYDRHVALGARLLEELDVRGATMVVHDWGGPIGLRLAVEHAERIDRLVITDSGIFTGNQRMNDAWLAFRDFTARTEDLPVGMLVRGACKNDPGDEVIAAYEAPYPNAASKAGARAFPALIPFAPDAPGAAEGRHTLHALREDTRPTLILWGDSDPVLPMAVAESFAGAIGQPPPRAIEDAGHFLQEDKGPEIGAIVAEWLTA
jgi:haloalkane dehalogenase